MFYYVVRSVCFLFMINEIFLFFKLIYNIHRNVHLLRVCVSVCKRV